MQKFIADFHIHSKYSRAVSKDMVLEELDRWADDKGILVMGTGDFTHPAWIKEIKNKLEPAEPGLFKLKKEFKLDTIKGTKAETRFILTTEISSIYTRNGKGHRVHNLVFAPDIETVEKINTQLSWVGNLASDGRPILGLDSEELLKIVINSNTRAVLIPAHAWTPWFSVFGSMSGFDSLEECFGENAKYVFAIETGLSSDPPMNWRVSKLDKIALISNSDSHSLGRIGREANIFNSELSYDGIIGGIKNSVQNKKEQVLIETIEFYPEEGKYHFDGHRNCGIYLDPQETKKCNGICSKCSRSLTIGVLNRVDKLADRPVGFKNPNRAGFRNLVTLDQIIAESIGYSSVSGKAVLDVYKNMIKEFGNELKILMDISEVEFRKSGIKTEIIEGIFRVRSGKLKIRPGYDGEYGEVRIFEEGELKKPEVQTGLF